MNCWAGSGSSKHGYRPACSFEMARMWDGGIIIQPRQRMAVKISVCVVHLPTSNQRPCHSRRCCSGGCADTCCSRLLVCRYQRYLEGVLETADEYQEVQDLLLRHATLQATNDDLRSHQQQCSQDAEEIRQNMQTFVKQKTDEILDLNNQVASLKKQLEQQEEQAGLLVSTAVVEWTPEPAG